MARVTMKLIDKTADAEGIVVGVETCEEIISELQRRNPGNRLTNEVCDHLKYTFACLRANVIEESNK